jgi:imidazolonepropionase
LKQTVADAAPKEQWTLVRRARQLLTLHGPSGPRRGAALKEPGIIQDGALLIRNGVIEEAGTTRRVENLAPARKARIIDAAGRIVMPSFVDPDAVLVYPQPSGMNSRIERTDETRIGLLSKERLGIAATAAATEWVRAGALTVGAHTSHAADLRDTVRILRLHQSLQAKPLRIRSIFSPVSTGDEKAGNTLFANLTEKWLSSIRQRKLATIVEFSTDSGLDAEQIRTAAVAAAELGYATRIRTGTLRNSAELELAVAAAAVSLIAPPTEPGEALRLLATMGCVHVLPLTWSLREGRWGEGVVRREIEHGIPVALASGFRTGGPTVINPQHILHLAVERFGMSIEEAIVAATYNAACALRMSHVTGSLEPGKSADLLVMDVPDYRDLHARVGSNDVQLAMRAGNVVYRRAGLTLD